MPKRKASSQQVDERKEGAPDDGTKKARASYRQSSTGLPNLVALYPDVAQKFGLPLFDWTKHVVASKEHEDALIAARKKKQSQSNTSKAVFGTFATNSFSGITGFFSMPEVLDRRQVMPFGRDNYKERQAAKKGETLPEAYTHSYAVRVKKEHSGVWKEWAEGLLDFLVDNWSIFVTPEQTKIIGLKKFVHDPVVLKAELRRLMGENPIKIADFDDNPSVSETARNNPMTVKYKIRTLDPSKDAENQRVTEITRYNEQCRKVTGEPTSVKEHFVMNNQVCSIWQIGITISKKGLYPQLFTRSCMLYQMPKMERKSIDITQFAAEFAMDAVPESDTLSAADFGADTAAGFNMDSAFEGDASL